MHCSPTFRYGQELVCYIYVAPGDDCGQTEEVTRSRQPEDLIRDHV